MNKKNIFKLLSFFIISIFMYANLQNFADWLIYSVLNIENLELNSALHFFVFETPKVLLLLTIIVFIVGIIRTFFTPSRTKRILSGKKEFIGNILASLLGVVTPFCSCSAVPLFIGFVTTGIPLGVTFSFLIAAPMINEVALILLFALFGYKVAAIYLITGLSIAFLSGLVIGKLKMEKYIQEWVFEAKKTSNEDLVPNPTWEYRINMGTFAVKDIVGKTWPYILIGIGVGAWIHGFVPENFMAELMGEAAGWWSVPLAVLLGVPMYAGAASMIPIVQALLAKGAQLGTALAFMMAVIGLSLPEMIILKKVLKIKLIITFAGIVAVGIIIVGYLFNFLF